MKKSRIIASIGIGFAVCAALVAGPMTSEAAPEGVNVPLNGKPLKRLSDYNLFSDIKGQVPNDRVVPYDLITPLFTDYTAKFRFVYLPDGTSATFHPEKMFEYPVGTVLVKTFGYLNDIRDESLGRQLIETRLLIHGEKGWTAWAYVYDETEEDAILKVAGARREMSWIHYDGNERSINYIVPNINQCKGCHIYEENMAPLGPKAWNLNRDYEYDHGSANQIDHWKAIGYLDGAPASEEVAALPVWNDESTGSLHQRARAYLEVNCSHCHNPAGPGNTSGLDLSWPQQNPYDWGVMRRPVAAGLGSGGRFFDIVPGKPDESILIYRMESLEPDVMMPEIPHLQVHDEGVQLLREWIEGLEDPA